MFRELLEGRLAGIASLAGRQAEALERHYELLVRWNRTLNLTSINGLEAAVERNYCESVYLASGLPGGVTSVADIGSGAGFPGFAVAVVRPDVAVTLIEAHRRKAVFLREATRGMENVRVAAVRAEEIGEEFDWAVSRAVSYEDLSMVLKGIARNADLLTGAEEPPEKMGFEWAGAVQLPWGKQRYVRRGRRVG